MSRKIPCLNVRGKLRFDPDDVAAALDKLAMGDEAGDTTKKWYRSRTLKAAIIIALVTIAGWFLIPFITKHSGPIQKNVSISPEVETRGNLSPAVVTSGPNSPVNIYLTPGQSETSSEVREMDVNRPK